MVACLALGRPRGDLSLIRRHILTLAKDAINMVHIWMFNKYAHCWTASNTSRYNNCSFLPIRKLFLQPVPALEPIRPVSHLLSNLRNHTIPTDNSSFKAKMILMYQSLLLHQQEQADSMTRFDSLWYVPSLCADGILSTRPLLVLGHTLPLHQGHFTCGRMTPMRSCMSLLASRLKMTYLAQKHYLYLSKLSFLSSCCKPSDQPRDAA